MGHDRYLRAQQHRARAIFILFGDFFFWPVRQRRLSATTTARNLTCWRCKIPLQRVAQHAQCGLDSGVRRPRTRGTDFFAHRALLCHCGRPSSCSNIMARCSTCVANRGKAPQADSREIRQKRAEAAAQRLAGLDWAAFDGGIRRWQARTWHG